MATNLLSSRALEIVGLSAIVASVCLLTVPYHLFPQFYVPKINPNLGYISPATAEGWAFLISGTLLLVAGVATIVLFKQRSTAKGRPFLIQN